MNAPGRIALLRASMRVSRRGPSRRLVAGAILLTLLLLYLLLVFFPAVPLTLDPDELALALRVRPRLRILYLVAAATVAFAVLSLVAGVVIRRVFLDLSDQAPDAEGNAAWRRWGHLFSASVVPWLSGAFLLGVALGIVQIVRIPWAGWPLLVLLSPVILAIAGVGTALLLRSLLAGHLHLPAVAVEGSTPFVALGRASAWLRRAPFAVVLLRPFVAGLAVLETGIALAPSLGGAALLWLVLRALPGDPGGPVARTLQNGLGTEGAAADFGAGAAWIFLFLYGAWCAAALVCHLLGGRAGLYLLHRRELDGVPHDAPVPGGGPESSLTELGIELVQSLRGREEE